MLSESGNGKDKKEAPSFALWWWRRLLLLLLLLLQNFNNCLVATAAAAEGIPVNVGPITVTKRFVSCANLLGEVLDGSGVASYDELFSTASSLLNSTGTFAFDGDGTANSDEGS